MQRILEIAYANEATLARLLSLMEDIDQRLHRLEHGLENKAVAL